MRIQREQQESERDLEIAASLSSVLYLPNRKSICHTLGMDTLQKLRDAYRELKIARDMVKGIQVFRGGGDGLGFNSRKQSRNLSDGVDFSVQHIETALNLIEAVGKALKKSGPR